MSRESQIQNSVIEKLKSMNIFPASVIFTYAGGYDDGMLGITLYLEEDLDEFLDLLEYKTQCDKSGYWINKETNTVILTGLALINLYTLL